MTADNNKPSLSRTELAELKQLIAASSDRGLTADECAKLEQMLSASREARSVYIAYMQLDAGLDWKIRGTHSVDAALERSCQTATILADSDGFEQSAVPAVKRIRSFSLLALAASLFFVVATTAWIVTKPREPEKVADAKDANSEGGPAISSAP